MFDIYNVSVTNIPKIFLDTAPPVKILLFCFLLTIFLESVFTFIWLYAKGESLKNKSCFFLPDENSLS